MLIESIYDLIGAFGIGGGNHLFTVGTVENQHGLPHFFSNFSIFSSQNERGAEVGRSV